MPSDKSAKGRLNKLRIQKAHPKRLVGPSEIPVADWYLFGSSYNQNAIASEINRLISSGQLRKVIRKFIKDEFKRCPELRAIKA